MEERITVLDGVTDSSHHERPEVLLHNGDSEKPARKPGHSLVVSLAVSIPVDNGLWESAINSPNPWQGS